MNSAGTRMCHGDFSYWCRFTNEVTGKAVHLSGYLRKGDLWTEARERGANSKQLREMKEAMSKAPTKRMYVR